MDPFKYPHDFPSCQDISCSATGGPDNNLSVSLIVALFP